jgi:hypothetical protein
MKDQPSIPQELIDETVERVLTGKYQPQPVECFVRPRPGAGIFVRHSQWLGDDLNRQWREQAFRQKRTAGRAYFSAPPEMVIALLDSPDEANSINASTGENENRENVTALQQKIRFLEMQLESHRPYLQLYRLGGGSLFVAVLSLVVWLLTGTGIPFHPIFAVGVIPAAIGLIAMAFLIRSSSKTPKRN